MLTQCLAVPASLSRCLRSWARRATSNLRLPGRTRRPNKRRENVRSSMCLSPRGSSSIAGFQRTRMAGMLVVLAGPGSLSTKPWNCWNIPVSWQIGFDRVCFPGRAIAASLIRALFIDCFFCDDPQCLVYSFSLFILFLFFSCVTLVLQGLDCSFSFWFLWGNLCLDTEQSELG